MLQAVTAIVHIGEARQLATLCDGALQLLDQESLEGKHVPSPKVRSSLLGPAGCHHVPLLFRAAFARSTRHLPAQVLPQADAVSKLQPRLAWLLLVVLCAVQAQGAMPLL